MEPTGLLGVMDQVAESLQFPIDLDETLGIITAGAVAAMPGIEYASISLTRRDGRIETLAPTDVVAVKADELQYELSEGPCLDAALEEPVVRVDDIRTDPRWPAYGPRVAKELGIGAQIAFQFRAEPHVRGGVNLYSGEPGTLTDETQQLGFLFANLVAVALGWSRQDETMTQALGNRDVVGKAIGIVMERYRLDPDRAFSFLLRTSQAGNIKLRDVAAGIVADAIERTERTK
ncbi:MAG TPA: GAF and ANTAR domain-containing protein [Kribbella sp.]